MSMLETAYNKIYSNNKGESIFGEGKPENVVVNILNYLKSGSAFEFGAGEGRNSLFLARNGFKVKVLDISSVGIKKIQEIAKGNNIEIKADIGDIRNFKFDQNFDVFVSTFVLQHLKKDEALKIIKLMQDHTSKTGLNALTVFMKKGEFLEKNEENLNFFPNENELRNLYKDWEILRYGEHEVMTGEKNKDGSNKMNFSADLLARKKN